MNKSAAELYQAVILNHNRNPHGYGDIANSTHRADGFNPICGDKVSITCLVEGEKLSRVGFTAQSCALCRASASVLMESATGLPTESVRLLIRDFESMIQGAAGKVVGDASAFAAIKDYPARAKCVILPWRTLESALIKGDGDFLNIVSTEVQG